MDGLGSVVAYVPIKARSTRVPRKNFMVIKSPEVPQGEPLWQRIIRILHSCVWLDEIVVDTDSAEIRNSLTGNDGDFGWQLGTRATEHSPKVSVIPRAAACAEATASYCMYHTRQRMYDKAAQRSYADVWLHTHACAPALTAQRIEEALRLLVAHPWLDSVFAARRVEGYWFWLNGKPLYDLENFPRTQEWPDELVRETNTLYVIRDAALLDTRCKIGKRPLPLYVNEHEAVDVNSVADLKGWEIEPAPERELNPVEPHGVEI